jgi:FkbM family methyltransferase
MLCDLRELVKKYNLDINHILHIGAHFGQELDVYEQLATERVLMFEPVPDTFAVLEKRVKEWSKAFPKKVLLANIALGSSSNEIEMYIEKNNKSMSSSLLKPKLHLEQYDWIKFDDSDKISVRQCRLDDYLASVDNNKKFDFINIDVQGYELEVFKGALQTLENIKAIYTEVNRAELYENCCMVSDLDEFLGAHGFQRVETNWEGISWGDALYVRRNNEN